MTALMALALLGLFPAALSSGIGFESQKPLAVVIKGCLVIATKTNLNYIADFRLLVFQQKTE
jgi:cobalt-zinc-cadmium resistance protein CzcA